MGHGVEGVFKVNVHSMHSLALSPSFLLDEVHHLHVNADTTSLRASGSEMLAGSTIFFNSSLITFFSRWYTLFSKTDGRWSDVIRAPTFVKLQEGVIIRKLRLYIYVR